MPAAQSHPVSPSRSGLLTNAADFDGDSKPDLAIGKEAGRAGYTVEVRFSSRIPPVFLTVANAGPAITVSICDVNRDQAPDVVVKTAASPIPLAVWLSDGNGHFREVCPWTYLPSSMDGSPNAISYSFNCEQANMLQEKRLDPDALLPTRPDSTPPRQRLRAGRGHSVALQLLDCEQAGRSPPPSL